MHPVGMAGVAKQPTQSAFVGPIILTFTPTNTNNIKKKIKQKKNKKKTSTKLAQRHLGRKKNTEKPFLCANFLIPKNNYLTLY